MLTLPGRPTSPGEIGRDVDPDAVFAARAALRAALGRHLTGALFDHYRRYRRPALPARMRRAPARALRNTRADLMVATRRPDAITLAARQYQAADNMTDRLAALGHACLRRAGPRRRASMISARYRGDDPLIVDKWFTLRAFDPGAGDARPVKALTAHPASRSAIPNRLRSLISAFAMANQKEFNRADGAGYDFVVETVLALDPRNPQVAARLLSALKSWRVLEARRRGRAEAALRRVAAASPLSADVRDIVGRTLGEA